MFCFLFCASDLTSLFSHWTPSRQSETKKTSCTAVCVCLCVCDEKHYITQRLSCDLGSEAVNSTSERVGSTLWNTFCGTWRPWIVYPSLGPKDDLMSAEETAHSESCMQDAHAAGDLNSTGESSGEDSSVHVLSKAFQKAQLAWNKPYTAASCKPGCSHQQPPTCQWVLVLFVQLTSCIEPVWTL